MTRSQLILRSLAFYWRSHLAVIAGVATAVAVLAGALLVGDSVRGSLRALVLDRLGASDQVVVSEGFFREQLAADVEADPAFQSSFTAASPLIAVRGIVTVQESGRRAGRVSVYGVDDRFWRFHGVAQAGPEDRQALLSPALAAALGAAEGDAILVRVQRPTDAPLESLHGRKDDLGRAVRLTVAGVQPRDSVGEFSLEPQQGDVLAVFVPLSRLQQEIEVGERINALLVSSRGAEPSNDLQAIVGRHTTLDDLGLRIKAPGAGAFFLESDAGLIDDRVAAAAEQAIADLAGAQSDAVFTYVANALRIGDREIPYSLVTAIDLRSIAPALDDVDDEGIVLTRWAADDLGARAGDTLTLEYYVWEEPGQLVTRSTDLRVAGIVPLNPGDRDLAPTYPGISDSPTLDDWDPPFPVDLRRVRPVDEAFWQEYRTTPKAYVPFETGQRLWRSRYGAMTSLRVTAASDEAPARFEEALRAAIDPAVLGPVVRDVRTASLDASRGATNFGEYFVYFSFFLVVSALLLASLFFKLGVEQRVREVGLLRAVGLGPPAVRRLFLTEGLLLAVVGGALGVLGALAYAWVLMYGLRTWWVDAVGTTALTLHVNPLSLAVGAIGGLAAAVACIWWTLRSLDRISARGLLAGDLASAADASASGGRQSGRRVALAGALLAAIGAGLLAAGAAEWLDPAGAFFGAGFALLAAALCGLTLLLRRRPRQPIQREGWQPLWRLGLRNSTYRPGRSVLSIAVVACATFILVSVDAFRRDGHAAESGPRTGLGGYALIVETILPVVHDPNTTEGREALNLFDMDEAVAFEPFRLLPGDDASCLNLYRPTNPRILAPRDSFRAEGRFQFASSLATTDAERANPWLLLDREEPGVVPVIADANSMTYVLHRALGDEIVLTHGERQITLRIVAALRDSIFQGELLMSQANFLRLFPEQEGYQVLLVEAPANQVAEVETTIEDALRDFGADATTTAEKLAQFHRVENTYLSTFQTLGGLGLLLGTVGLATVLLRNVLERRRELALLGAVGYRKSHVLLLILAENVLLLAGGLAIGALCAGLAIAPAVAERGGRLPLTGGGALLLIAILGAGLVSSLFAMRAATRSPLLASLRSE